MGCCVIFKPPTTGPPNELFDYFQLVNTQDQPTCKSVNLVLGSEWPLMFMVKISCNSLLKKIFVFCFNICVGLHKWNLKKGYVMLNQTVLLLSRYMTLNIADSVTENIIHHFPQVKCFIDECLANGGKVLIHGNGGISRSAALTIAYVMEKYNLSRK